KPATLGLLSLAFFRTNRLRQTVPAKQRRLIATHLSHIRRTIMKGGLGLLALFGTMAALPALANDASDIFTVRDPASAIFQQFGVTEAGVPLGGAVCLHGDLGACSGGAEQDFTPAGGAFSLSAWYLPITGLADPSMIGRITQLAEPGGGISDW